MLNRLKLFIYQQEKRLNTLQIRLLASALAMIVIILPVIGVLLNSAFSEQIHSGIKNELSAYSYAILAVAEVEDQQLLMPEQLLENQFNVSESGLYAMFTLATNQSIGPSQMPLSNSQPSWASPSFLGMEKPIDLPAPALGSGSFNNINIANKPHFIYSFTVSFSEVGQSLPLTLHIIKDQADYLLSVQKFKQQLWLWLLVLMMVLLVLQIIWLRFSLKPLQIIQQELVAVEQGQAQKLHASYPIELARVAKQLNVLLNTEQLQRQRYRNALSDLAHSLKTPLAVIQTQDELSETSKQQLSLINKTIEHQLKRAQSAGQSAWHLGVKIKPCVDKLVNALTKIYQHKQLTITSEVADKALFKGDEADLLEILGNLLDNACKAANQQVNIRVSLTATELIMTIADDGMGIEPDQRRTILTRGGRADTYQQGHGIGLAIVTDLLLSYQGKLQIEQSSELGGALFIISFVL